MGRLPADGGFHVIHGSIALLSYLQDFLQHLWCEVSSRDNRYRLAAGRELIAMEQGCRCRYGSAGFGDEMCVESQTAHALPNLVFAYAEETIDVALNVFEVVFPYALSAQSIGDRS